MNHLEELVYEYYDWSGYLVKRNIHVGRLRRGGYEMELDIVAYNPNNKRLIHIEPSIDADSWPKRELRFEKKFNAGKKYILKDIFPWLKDEVNIEQIAILITRPQNRKIVGGGEIKSIDEFVKEIEIDIIKQGIMANNAIPQQYPLLRTIQLLASGYYKKL